MGMGTAPCHGFVLEATEETMKKLGWDFETLKRYSIREYEADRLNSPTKEDLENFDTVMEFLALELDVINLHKDGKIFDAQIMRYNEDEGDRYDDLTTGIYLSFDESCLYEKKVTAVGEMLKNIDLLPKEQQWTNFG